MGTDIHGVFQKRTATDWEDVPSKYDERRHYQLFAVLAGVRNGYGFAGTPTGEAVTPISDPRGIPADFRMDGETHPVASRELMGRRAQYHAQGEPVEIWMGDHTHSWLTGAEILAWAERAPCVVKTGIVSREQYAKLDREAGPDAWCGMISGHGIVIVNDNAVEMEATPGWTHVRVHWESALKRYLAYFFDEVARLVSEHGEVRFVFGFDS